MPGDPVYHVAEREADWNSDPANRAGTRTAVDFSTGESAIGYAEAAKRRRPPWQDDVIRSGMANEVYLRRSIG